MAEPLSLQDYVITPAITGSGTGANSLDCRAGFNYAYVAYATYGQSAVYSIQASHDNTAWSQVLTVSATTTVGTAQISAFYPYVRGITNAVYSGAGSTGSGYLWYGAGRGR